MVWQFSSEASAALETSHYAISKVEVWHSGIPTGISLGITGGDVGADATRPIRRNLNCELYDPTGALTNDDIGELISPYDCEAAAFRGVSLPTGDEYAPQGVFRLTRREIRDDPDGISIGLTGQDRSVIYQGSMDSALGIPGNTKIETAISRLLARRNPGLLFDSYETGFTCGPLIIPANVDVWAEAQRLAAAAGASLYHSRTGIATLAPAGPTGAPSSFYTAKGTLVRATLADDYDTVRNVVVMENSLGTVRYTAEDTDPNSPTFAGGKYGRQSVTVVNPHLGSVDQAKVAAFARLLRELGLSETGAIEVSVNPAQDVDETMIVDRPLSGFNRRALVVASFRMPLAIDDSLLEIIGRRSVVAQDGQILPEEGGEL